MLIFHFLLSLLSSSFLVPLAVSHPLPQSVPPSTPTCLSALHALHIASTFNTLVSAYTNSTASSSILPDFSGYSDSTLSLVTGGCPSTSLPLGSPLFTSLEDFQAGQSFQPNIPIELLNLWFGCTSVTVRWRSRGPVPDGDPNGETQQVTGIAVLEMVQGSVEMGQEEWMIKTLWQEFNTLAWAVDAGAVQPNCAPGRKRAIR